MYLNESGMRKENRKWYVLMFVNVLLIVLLLFVGLTDETKDDLGMQLYLTGCDGAPTYYYVWASVFRTVATYFLQRLFPAFAWNYLLQVVFIFICINIICWKIMCKMDGYLGVIFGVFTAVLIFFETIATLNYTKTAVLIMCTGTCLLFGKSDKKQKFFGGVMFVLGSLYRFKLVCIPVGFLPIICLWHFVRSEESFSVKVKRCIKEYLIPLFAIFIIVVGLEFVGTFYMDHVPQFKALRDRNILSERLLDYDLKPYDEVEKEYQQWGITENDCNMVKSRMSNSDSQYFTNELYQTMIDHFSQRWNINISADMVKDFAKDIGKYLSKSVFGWFILLLLAFVFFCLRPKHRWLPVLTALSLATFLTFFYIMGRVVNRISFGIYLWVGITLLICLESADMTEKCRKALQGVLKSRVIKSGAVLLLLAGTAAMSAKYQRQVNGEIAEAFDYMTENREYFYFYTRISEEKAINNLLLMKDYWDTGNCFYSSNFDVSVNDFSKMQTYGIDNIYRDAVDSDVIRFVDNMHMEQIEQYVREHYCADAKAVQVDKVGNYNVYRIVSQQQ